MAGELGVSQSVISRLVHRFRDTGSIGERPRSGAPRSTTRNDDQYLRTYALRNRDLTAPVLQSRLREVRGTRVSRQTIRNRLHHFGLRTRRPLQVTPLTDRHRRLHLQWDMQQWSSALFTDESRITLHRNDGRQRRWMRRGERNAPVNVVPRYRYGGGGVTVWAGMSTLRKPDLVIINGTVTGRSYLRDIINPIIIPQHRQYAPHFIFMDDNAPPHRANIVRARTQEVGLRHMEWSTLSPDLNPLEHGWDQLKRYDLPELRNAVVEEWNELPQNNFNRLVRSMRRRCQAVIDARGGNTRY